MHPKSNNASDFEAELTKMEFEGVAKRHGLDLKRIISIYERCPDFGFIAPVLVPFETNLDRAIAIMGKEKALELFESEDLYKLAERIALVDDINLSSDLPLYSLDELASVTEDFIQYLSNNQEDLLRAGSPRTRFSRSTWLGEQLSNLYHFEFPIGIKDPPMEDRLRLEAARYKLFNLKSAILKELLGSIKPSTPVSLWEKCLPLLIDEIPAEEAEFYLRMDQDFYLGYDIREERLEGGTFGFDRAGGLTDLFEIMGHYEEELNLGSFAKTRIALGELVKFKEFGRPSLFVNTYYESVEHPLREKLDSALDLYLSLTSKIIEFWKKYTDRVNQALENEFYVEIPGEKIKRKFLHSYGPFMKKVSALAKSTLEVTGRLPRISVTEDEDKKIREQYVFRREGEIWTTIYNGIMKRFKDARGFHYIAHLLKNPGKEFDVLELVREVEKSLDHPIEEIYSKMDTDQLEEYDLTQSWDNGEQVADKKYQEEIGEALHELDKQKAKENNPEKVLDIEEKMKRIIKFSPVTKVKASKGKKVGYRLRKFTFDRDRARHYVSKAIFRSLKAIQKENPDNPDLYRHLNNSLRPINFFPRYKPERMIDWVF